MSISLLKKSLPFLKGMRLNKEISTFSILPGEIHIWVVNLEGIDQGHYFREETLAEEELDRSKRYLFEQDRLRFVAGRSILRRLLSLYTSIAPAEIIYQTNPFGKLSLPQFPLFFNNSNSHDRIAFAFTMEAEIGVDIERVHTIPDLSYVMEFYFSPEERAEISTLTPATQREAFYNVWTQRKRS
jgi:4'-phosphopantetheinyl transferase